MKLLTCGFGIIKFRDGLGHVRTFDQNIDLRCLRTPIGGSQSKLAKEPIISIHPTASSSSSTETAYTEATVLVLPCPLFCGLPQAIKVRVPVLAQLPCTSRLEPNCASDGWAKPRRRRRLGCIEKQRVDVNLMGRRIQTKKSGVASECQKKKAAPAVLLRKLHTRCTYKVMAMWTLPRYIRRHRV